MSIQADFFDINVFNRKKIIDTKLLSLISMFLSEKRSKIQNNKRLFFVCEATVYANYNYTQNLLVSNENINNLF